MKRVITYGTFDLLHEGHINLLRRAKALGDYLIVGVTSPDFDVNRGKINVRQSIMERIEAVKATGLADEVIPEEYVGQKIDDIINYRIDIFAIGSDWRGQFDYLKEYCQVVYLERTPGISSTQLRNEERPVRLGIVGYSQDVEKFIAESRFVCGVEICGIFYCGSDNRSQDQSIPTCGDLGQLYELCDAIYVANEPKHRYSASLDALRHGKHVLCESPVALSAEEASSLFDIAATHDLIFQEGIKTAHALAYKRLILMLKSGKIGDIVSVKSTCTSMARDIPCGSLVGWGPIACLPIFDILGVDYTFVRAASVRGASDKDLYTNIDFVFPNACASLEVGYGAKSEGELVVSGTNGYVLVPSPWWKPDYFEMRFEDFTDNKKFFFQLNGEGLRQEILEFIQMIKGTRRPNLSISKSHSVAFSGLLESYFKKTIPVYTLKKQADR